VLPSGPALLRHPGGWTGKRHHPARMIPIRTESGDPMPDLASQTAMETTMAAP
jgi:hypothetical protein